MIVERHEIGAPAAPPPALTVPHLVDDDPVNPGAQRGLPAEARERPKDAQEDLLRHVERLVAVAQKVQGEVEDGPLMRRHQVGTRRLIACDAPLDERGFAAIDF